MRSQKKDIVIEYSESDGLKKIIADGNEMPDIVAIQNKDMEEWFKESDGRDGWEGLIEEIIKFIDVENPKLIFKFKGSDSDKERFREIIGDYGYELQEASRDDFFKGDLDKAKKCKARGFTREEDEYLKKAANGNSPVARFELAEKCYKKYSDKSIRIKNNPELTEMVSNYKKAAENGSTKAQMRLVEMYENGEFVDKDEKEAHKWNIRLANSGDNEAQLKVGDYYKKEKNYTEAEKWYDKAAKADNIIAKDKWGIMFLEGGVFYNKRNNKITKKALERVKDAAYNGYDMAQYNMGLFYKNGENGLQKNLVKAYEWYKKAAEQGNQYAQKTMGDFLLYGRGVSKDENEAYSWYEKAAKNGNQDAQARLGKYYYDNKQYEEAYKWLEKSAYKGNKQAQRILAGMYENGEFVDKDEKEAHKWNMRLANSGDNEAQLKVGDYYKKEKNYTEAEKWYDKAAEAGNIIAKDKWGVMFLDGGVFQNRSNELRKKGLERVEDAANKGYIMAQYNMGLFYKNGENGLQKNLGKAYEWYKKAANQGNQYAQKTMGDFLLNGMGVNKDEKEACRWYKEAAKQGNKNSQVSLGKYYYDNKQYTTAYEWLKKAAEQGDKYSMLCLGNMHYSGMGIEKNFSMAMENYKNAAESGDDEAQNQLGVMYYKGECEEKDYNKAYECFKKAAEQNNSHAQKNIGKCCEEGKGIKKDINKAYEWYKKAADNTNEPSADCCYKIGKYYYDKVSNEKKVITGVTVAASVLVPITNLVTIPAGLIGSAVGRKMRFTSFLKSDAGKEMMKYFRKGAELGNEECKKKIDEIEEMQK